MKSKPNSPFLKCLAVAALVSGVLSLSGCGNAPTANSSANSVSSAEGGETTSSLTPDTPSTENPDTPSSEVPSSEESSNEEPSPKIKSFQLDSGNGKINGSSYGESKEGEVTYSDALDADGHAFSLTYHCCMGHAGDFAQVKKGAGYIFNTYALPGLVDVQVSFANSSSVTVSFADSASALAKNGTAISSGESVSAKGKQFFRIDAGTDAVTYIESIKIRYTGDGSVVIPDDPLTPEEPDTPTGKEQPISDDNHYKATSINDKIDFNRMDGAVPTIGTEDMLVVPVDFTDYKFSNSEIEDIKTLTGGSSDETNYWESLGSFYKKSSYDKLNMRFTYADTYHVGRTAKAFATDSKYTADGYGWTGCLEVLEGAVSAYKKNNGPDSTKKFDKDGDGFIDAVIMIYACPNDYDDTIAAFDVEQAYWAYRWCDYNMYESADVNSPVGFNFFWASLDFFYEDTGSRQNHTGIDAHTLIHETGHLLGADDYYNTCTDRQSGGEYHETKSPAGGVMMMDMNRTDHDAFTKMSYGWVEPYVVTGSTEITIKASQVNGDTIILADNWNGTAFDEYIALELYTPSGLNGVDAASVDYNKAGVRMLHVDARLAKATDYNESTDAYVNPTYVKDDEKIDQESYYYFVPARNSAAEDMAPAKGKGYDLISLISAKGNTFTEDRPSTSADLFQTGDSFSISDASASKYFATKGRLNNGAKLPYKIEMVKVTATEATIRFTKFA